MNKEIEILIRKNTIRDIELELAKAREIGVIIPDEVDIIINRVEKSYDGN